MSQREAGDYQVGEITLTQGATYAFGFRPADGTLPGGLPFDMRNVPPYFATYLSGARVEAREDHGATHVMTGVWAAPTRPVIIPTISGPASVVWVRNVVTVNEGSSKSGGSSGAFILAGVGLGLLWLARRR